MTVQHQKVREEINSIITVLVETGLVDDQNFAFIEQTHANTYLVRYSGNTQFGTTLRQVLYEDMYRDQLRDRAFNILMLDGALVQMTYVFESDRLIRHRLAFLPSPDLLDFQNAPELYSEELLYADVIDKRVVTVPLRFDYDARPGIAVPVTHPESHLTLGQYSRCRIPVTAGLTPHSFIRFVLSSFYGTSSQLVPIRLPSPKLRFNACITEPELREVHIGVPTYL